MTEPTKCPVRPAKTQVSLGIHPDLTESSLCTQWVAKDPSFLHADTKVSDHTGQMPRLIFRCAHRSFCVAAQMDWLLVLLFVFVSVTMQPLLLKSDVVL